MLANSLYRLYALLFAKKIFMPLHRVMYRLALRGMGVMNSENDFISGERFILRLLSRSQPKLIVDVGANEGQFAALCLQNTQAKVISFEPHPVTFDKLQKRHSKEPRWMGIDKALGRESGAFKLYDHAGGEGTQHASLQEGVFESVYNATPEAIDVGVLTLDEFAKKHGIDHISLLKIDVEGFELAVIEGAQELMASGKVEMVLFEFNSMNVSSGSSLAAFQRCMPDYNFYRLLPNALLPLSKEAVMFREIFVFQNILAVPSKSSVSF